MKFRYDNDDNYFELFNEAQGIVTFKSEIKKDPSKVDSYTGRCFDVLKLVGVLFVVALIFNLINSEWFISEFAMLTFAIFAAFAFGLYIVFFISYFQQKDLTHSGEVEFDERGLFDKSDSGIRVGIDWNLIDLVVIKDNIIVLLSKSNFYFSFGEDLVDRVIEGLNKYHPDVATIDCSIKRYQSKLQEELKYKNEIEVKEEVTEEVKEEIEEETELVEVKEEVKETKVKKINKDVNEEIKDFKNEIKNVLQEVKVEKITGVMIEPPVIEKIEEVEVVEDEPKPIIDEPLRVEQAKFDLPIFNQLNPISGEVVDMDKDTIKEIIIPPFDETMESIDDE